MALNVNSAKGKTGEASYTHIKYSDDGGSTFTGNGGDDPGTWLGQYSDNSPSASTDVNDYTWAKIQGPPSYRGTLSEL